MMSIIVRVLVCKSVSVGRRIQLQRREPMMRASN